MYTQQLWEGQDFHRVVEEAAAAAVDLEVADVGAEVREAVLVVEAAAEAADVEVLEEAEVVAAEVLETAAVLETVEDEEVDVVLEAVEVAVEVVEAGEAAVAAGVDSKEAKLLSLNRIGMKVFSLQEEKKTR